MAFGPFAEGVDMSNLNFHLHNAGKEALDAFHHAWTREVYDTVAVMEGIDLQRQRKKDMSQFAKEHTEEFFTDLLDLSKPCDPLQKQRETSIEQASIGKKRPIECTCRGITESIVVRPNVPKVLQLVSALVAAVGV